MKAIKRLGIILSLLIVPGIASANHGPGTSGGGATIQSGETIKENTFVFSLDETYTSYENLSDEEIASRASRSGEFDALSDAFLTNASIAFGLTDNLQLEANIGWYSGRGFVDAHAEEEHSPHAHNTRSGGAEVESASGNPEGLADLGLRAKYRMFGGEYGHLSVIAGVVLPTGDDNERLSNGEKLEPSSQPGSGRYSTVGGIAYSRYLSTALTLDVSSVYSYRFERDDFKVGDRFDSGVALSYRLSDSVRDFPYISLFTELTHQYIGKDEESGTDNENSGGDTVFLTPGVRGSFSENISLILAFSFPV